MLASMLPEPLRYDDRARAACLRVEMFLDAIAPVRMRGADEGAVEANHVDPGLTAGIRGAA